MKMGKLLFLFIAHTILSCSGDNYKNMEGEPAEIPADAMHALQTEEDLDVLIEEMGESQLVLLGEASHGTSEFYTWRAAISRRLIEEEGFDLIAVEADWADVTPLNEYISGNSQYSTAEDALEEFDRWPEWMWANEEIAELAEWLRNYNAEKPEDEQVGFYGLDVYGIWESLNAVIAYLDRTNPEAAQTARQVQECFAPYDRDEQAYARATINSSENCADEVAVLLETMEKIVEEKGQQDEAAFNALQNARVVAHAEAYYRAAVRSNSTSWNVRDAHMMGTVNQLIDFHGDDSRVIIWEHNTHVGDARATDMVDAGMINIGQLAREQYGEDSTYIVGFGTYDGRVIAAPSWGSRREVMNVPNAQRNSWEWFLHRQGPKNKIIFSEELGRQEFYQQKIGHRAIGVVYNPNAESGNYVPSVIPQRYDAFIFIDKTTALKPLD